MRRRTCYQNLMENQWVKWLDKRGKYVQGGFYKFREHTKL
jgi:hypothetical protein